MIPDAVIKPRGSQGRDFGLKALVGGDEQRLRLLWLNLFTRRASATNLTTIRSGFTIASWPASIKKYLNEMLLRCEQRRSVELAGSETVPAVRFVCAGIWLDVPEDFERLPLRVILNTRKTYEWAVADFNRWLNIFNQIEALADTRQSAHGRRRGSNFGFIRTVQRH